WTQHWLACGIGARYLYGVLAIATCLSFTPLASAGFQGESSAALQSTAEQEITLLEPGKPLQREIAGGQKHSYQIALGQGEHASVIVEQRGVDVTIKSYGRDGKLIAEQDGENRPIGVERAELVARATGSYRFDVEPKYPMLPGGRYEIRLEE